MQRFDQWLQGVLSRPRSTIVLIAFLAGLAFVTSAWAYAINATPPNALSGGGSPPAPATSAVTVTLYDNRIEASQASFTPGVQYHLKVVNRGTTNHELMVMPRVMGMGMASMPMAQLDHMSLANTGDMAPGATKAFGYTFSSTMAGHQLELGCYYPGHYESGMHMAITIG